MPYFGNFIAVPGLGDCDVQQYRTRRAGNFCTSAGLWAAYGLYPCPHAGARSVLCMSVTVVPCSSLSDHWTSDYLLVVDSPARRLFPTVLYPEGHDVFPIDMLRH